MAWRKMLGLFYFTVLKWMMNPAVLAFSCKLEIHGANGSMTNLKGLTHIRPILQYQSGFMMFRNQYHKLVYLSGTLLRKWLQGETQNASKCLNSIVWTCCSKNTFVSKKIFEMEIRSGVLRFDDGTDGMRDVFQILVCLVQLKIQNQSNIISV